MLEELGMFIMLPYFMVCDTVKYWMARRKRGIKFKTDWIVWLFALVSFLLQVVIVAICLLPLFI